MTPKVPVSGAGPAALRRLEIAEKMMGADHTPLSKPADGAVAPMTPEEVRAARQLFKDQALRSIEGRALAYLRAGAAVHFRGPAGAGKTTLALETAAELGRPIVLVTGDGWLTAEHLIGGEIGERTDKIHDRYVHSVTRTSSATKAIWEDRALTVAMEQGFTLVYDEFTRSPPEANNPLLAALEERVLILTSGARSSRVIKAHPDFSAIFTSNSVDYAAVKAPQDALLDRMITFELGWQEIETEIGVVAERSGLTHERATPIVRLVRALRALPKTQNPPSMRTAIMIARIVESQDLAPSFRDERFIQLCFDVLEARAPSADREARDAYFETLRRMILTHCHGPAAEAVAENDADEDANFERRAQIDETLEEAAA